jgi:DNA uptake protein ComE-like DNA-binding protein
MTLAGRPARVRSAQRAQLLICGLLLPATASGAYRLMVSKPYPPGQADLAAEPCRGVVIDPNTAAWWELTVVPGIGEVTAKRIVEFREKSRQESPARPYSSAGSVKVFGCAADLQRVKGIGPKTAARVEPHLAFGPAAPPEPAK